MKRLARWIVLAFIGITLTGPCIASDRPLVAHVDGQTYWLANLFDYDDLREFRGHSLSARLGPDDWALWPPVRHDPDAVRTDGQLKLLRAPSGEHWLGTDDRGRDVAARLVHGARTSLVLAALCVFFATLLGLGVAALAHAFRRLDPLIVGIVDGVAAIPILVLVVAVQGLSGRASLGLAAVLIAVPRAAECARIARAELARAGAQPFAAAARASGVGPGRLFVRHLLPQATRPILIAAAITAATAVVAEAGLSFVGFGAPPPTASWGELLRQAADHDLRWWLAVPAGLLISVLASALLRLAASDASAGRFGYRPARRRR